MDNDHKQIFRAIFIDSTSEIADLAHDRNVTAFLHECLLNEGEETVAQQVLDRHLKQHHCCPLSSEKNIANSVDRVNEWVPHDIDFSLWKSSLTYDATELEDANQTEAFAAEVECMEPDRPPDDICIVIQSQVIPNKIIEKPPAPTFVAKPNSHANFHSHSHVEGPKIDEPVEKKSSVVETVFRTAAQELNIQNQKANNSGGTSNKTMSAFSNTRKSSAPSRRALLSPPAPKPPTIVEDENEVIDERLKFIDPKMVEQIKSEIMNKHSNVTWDDIAGLDSVKTILLEAVVWPMLRPDIFNGLRSPPRGILLFGPPGTGKSLIGKCIASQSNSTFFSISASSLTSKWIGDGEKMVRALFTVATVHQPSVVFIDEVDSLLSRRSDNEHESSRRIKTEFLVLLDGISTNDNERILFIGATNRPQELDDAIRRRFTKRLYIPLPEQEHRCVMLKRLLAVENCQISDDEINEVGYMTEGFSGADMKTLCHEALMGPIRSIPFNLMKTISSCDVRPVRIDDFRNAVSRVRPSISPDDLEHFIKWNDTYGSTASNSQ